MSLISNIQKRGLKDIFSTRVFAYLESMWQKLVGVRIEQKDMGAYAEQVLYRGVVCKSCKEKGECIHCGCNFYDLSISKKGVCSEGHFGEIVDAKDWENYKKTYLVGTEIGFVKKNLDKKNG